MNKDLSISMLNDDDLMKVAGGYGEASIASGSFASSTGTALNLVVYWSVQDNGGQKVLKVTVSSSSYSLYCTGSACGVELVVNGMSYASGTPAIEYGGNSPVTNQVSQSRIFPDRFRLLRSGTLTVLTAVYPSVISAPPALLSSEPV